MGHIWDQNWAQNGWFMMLENVRKSQIMQQFMMHENVRKSQFQEHLVAIKCCKMEQNRAQKWDIAAN